MGKENRLIIGYIADEAITSQLSKIASTLGYASEWIDSAKRLGTIERRDRPGEPIGNSQSANLTSDLSNKQPALLIFDLDNEAIPTLRWCAILKSSPATRRIPILMYGAHLTPTITQDALRSGICAVVPREQFKQQAADLIRQHAHQIDYDAIANACNGPLSDIAQHGIDLFNQGQFYNAHHGLEDAWRADNGPARDLYRGILQVAVAYLQIERGNYRGAVKMFLRVRQWLDPLPDICRTVNIAQLRADSQAAQAHLTELGAEGVHQFDKRYFKPVQQISR